MTDEDRSQLVISVPRFTRGMKYLSIFAVVTWLLVAIYARVPHAGGVVGPLHWLVLLGARVVPHFELWRMFTYVLVPDPTGFGPLWAVLSFWWFGSPIEQRAGMATIVPIALAGTVGGAVLALIGSRLSLEMNAEPVVGLAPIANAFLVGWGFLNAAQKVSFFGLGPELSGKQFALVFGGVSLVVAVFTRSASALASVGGYVGAFVYMWMVTRGPGSKRPRGPAAPRKRRSSGERFMVVKGGRDDRHQWN